MTARRGHTGVHKATMETMETTCRQTLDATKASLTAYGGSF